MAESGFEQRDRDAAARHLRLVPAMPRNSGGTSRDQRRPLSPRLWRELKEPIAATLDAARPAPDVLPATIALCGPPAGARVIAGPGCRDPRRERWVDAGCVVLVCIGVVFALCGGVW